MRIKKIFKWIGVLFAVILFALLLSVLYVIFVIKNGDCSNGVFHEVLSPGGSYKAILFDYGCGTSKSYSTRVSVVTSSSDALPNQPGNTISFSGYNVPVSVVWISDSEISILSPTSKATYEIKTIKNKVTLSLSQ